jgi:hypothetical protein
MDLKSFRKETVCAQEKETGVYKDFDATQLYCPKCGCAMPVRKRLLLILPDGDKYEYRCARCAESVGTKIDRRI